MAKFSRFTPKAPQEEMEVDGDLSSFQDDQVYVYKCTK